MMSTFKDIIIIIYSKKHLKSEETDATYVENCGFPAFSKIILSKYEIN